MRKERLDEYRIERDTRIGRGIAGEAFDTYGYAVVFRWTAAAGLFAVLFVVLEGMRVANERRRANVQAAATGATAAEITTPPA